MAAFQKINPACRVFIKAKLFGNDPVRGAAEWANGLGATVSLFRVGTGEYTEYTPDRTLPQETFEVRSIDFNGIASLANDDLKRLSVLQNIFAVVLDSTKITDAGVTHLADCRALGSIYLTRTSVSDSSLKTLGQLPNITSLYLSLTDVSSDGLAHLARSPQLRTLELNRTKIDGLAIQHIAAIKTLETLSLSYNKIHDEDLVPLYGLRDLQRLILTNTQVTAPGIARLKQALP